MKKIRAAVVGYGNIGKFTLEALEAAPDLKWQVSCVVMVRKTNLPNWQTMKW